MKINPVVVRRYVEENFSIEKMAERYVALYRNAIRESSADRVA